ncbi:ABC transporter permease subunit [Achromobacter xylosoxidans]
MDYTLNFGAVWRNFEYLMSGLALSLGLAAVSILIGAAIGLALAFALTSRRLALSAPARLYVTLLRNLPILVLVLFAYFALPQLGSGSTRSGASCWCCRSIPAPTWPRCSAPGYCRSRAA